MKKTLAILISAILVVAAVCAFALTSGAAAATTVNVSVDGGTAIELNATTTTATHAGTGSFTFDASTGTLTLNNFKGNATFSNPNGDLTVKIVGTNEITTNGRVFDINNEGSFIFTSDNAANSLTATGKDFVFQAGSGSKFVFQDKAKVTINATTKDPVHFGGGGKGMTIKDNADVTVACSAANVRFFSCNANAQDSVLLIEGGKLTLNPTITNTWQVPLNVWQMKMTGGEVVINNTAATGQALLGIKIGFDDVQAEQTKGEFLGGKITLNFKTTYAVDPATAGSNARVYGIFGMNANKMTFKNMDIVYNADVSAAYRSASDYVGTNTWTGISGVISNQNKGTGITTKNDIEIDGCTFTINAPNATCAFSREKGTFTMKNTVVKGQAGTAFKNGDFQVDFDTCDFSQFTAKETFLGSGWTNLVPMSGDYSYIPLASSVVITAPDGKTTTLCKEAPTLTADQATALGIPADTFKYTEAKYVNKNITLPVFEMKNLPKDKVAKIHFTGNGSATVKVSGVNTISGTATVNSNLFNIGGAEIIGMTDDATLNVNAPTNGAGGYHFCFRRALIVDDVKINVYSENGDAIHGARSDYFPNNAVRTDVLLKGDTEINVEAYSQGMHIAGGSKSFTMQDNAKVSIKPVAKRNGADNTYLGNAFFLKADRDDGTGTMTLDFAMKDNASFKVEGKGVECNRIGAERDAEGKEYQVDAGTKVITTFTLEDNAKFDVEGNGQALYIYTSGKAEVAFVMKENASFKAVANDRPETHKEYNTGKYQSGLQINGSSIDVDLLGGTFHVEGERNTWNFGALALNSAKVDLLIQDTKFTVKSTNNTVDKYMDGNTEKPVDNNFINNAIIIPNGASVITIAGKSVVDVSATNDTAQTNRAHALWLQGTQKLIVKDEAVATFTAGGTATANTGAAIHSKGCEIIVQDKATLNASATGTASAAITLEGAAKLTVEGEAKVNADGGSVAGIRNYNASASGSVVVKGGTVIATGKSAISAVGKAVSVNAKTIEAGASASAAKKVDKLEYNEGYVKLSAVTVNQGGQGGSTTNPGTSDVNVALFAVVALATVAVAAAVVLRKKSI